MPKIEQNISVFRGMISQGSDNDLPPEYCSEQQDLMAQQDQIKTRSGFVKHNTAAFSGSILGIFQYKRKNRKSAVLSATDAGTIITGSSE